MSTVKVTVRAIYDRIIKTYGNSSSRTMLIHKSYSAYERLGAVFFTVEGSPPKGYAIYVPGYGYLIIIDAWGKTRRYQYTEVTDLDQFKDNDVLPEAMTRKNKFTGISVKASDPKRTMYHREYYRLYRAITDKRSA